VPYHYVFFNMGRIAAGIFSRHPNKLLRSVQHDTRGQIRCFMKKGRSKISHTPPLMLGAFSRLPSICRRHWAFFAVGLISNLHG
jgi:hypothetical protein